MHVAGGLDVALQNLATDAIGFPTYLDKAGPVIITFQTVLGGPILDVAFLDLPTAGLAGHASPRWIGENSLKNEPQE
jgi:hypothetical protein